MKTINIIDLINMHFEDHDLEIENKISAIPEYKKAEKRYRELVESLEKETMLKIDNEETRMETIAIDTAFNEGFKLAIQLIISSL